MSTTYPRTFSIETPDGEGEAIKDKSGVPWEISYPTGGMRWYGSITEVQAEIRRVLRSEYGKGDIVTFGKAVTVKGGE